VSQESGFALEENKDIFVSILFVCFELVDYFLREKINPKQLKYVILLIWGRFIPNPMN